jgi:hypothetical protein
LEFCWQEKIWIYILSHILCMGAKNWNCGRFCAWRR